MGIGIFFLVLFVLIIAALPIGGVFSFLSMLPHLANQAFSFGVSDVARAMFSGLNSFTLLAVPMFMVSGMIMARGGISKKLFNFFGYFIGNKTAGFPCAVVVTCMFYAAISGSSPATVSAVGSMTIPFLVQRIRQDLCNFNCDSCRWTWSHHSTVHILHCLRFHRQLFSLKTLHCRNHSGHPHWRCPHGLLLHLLQEAW